MVTRSDYGGYNPGQIDNPYDPGYYQGPDGSISASAGAPVSFEHTPVYSNGGFWGQSAAPSPVAQPPSFAGSGGGTDAGIPSGGPGGGGIPAPQSAPIDPATAQRNWLAGDSTFQDQQNQYNTQLQQFLDRLNKQTIPQYQQDFSTAQNAFNTNKNRNLLAMGEDWTSRGMANSGLFNQAQDIANKDYLTQQQGLDTANTRAMKAFDQQKEDRTNEISQAVENAKMQSLARMASDQRF